MLKKVIILLALLLSSSQAYFMTQNNTYAGNNAVLQGFDVPMDFIKDSVYASSKEVANHYRTQLFLKVLRQGHEFVPMIRRMIRENGVPEIILYLAMAESNFSPRAYSRKRAAGLWQFMPSTARRFGLKINDYLDERRDPIKSTEAAIKYLKYLHKMFGKWYLVAMAYNCGEGRLRKAIRRAKTDNIKVLLNKRKRYLPRETRHYIGKILAIASVSSSENFMVENGNDYLLNQGRSQTFDKVRVPASTSLASIAKSVGVSVKTIKHLNPQLRYYFTPLNKKNYEVYIPYGKKPSFASNFKASNNYNSFHVHVVKQGDNLWTLGRRYGIRHSLIKKFNHLRSNRLKLRQRLVIPTIVRGKRNVYTVRRGDTLGEISKRFRVTVRDIKRRNGIRKYIYPGDKIVIPSKK